MGGLFKTKEHYQAALQEDWESLINFYKLENNVMLPITIAKDTAIHMAVYSGSNKPLQDLLNHIPLDKDAYMIKNAYGNTALHEAASTGNFKAAKVLVESYQELLETLNNESELGELLETLNNVGETPLFRAAEYGKTEIVLYLASRNGQMTWTYDQLHREGLRLKPIHRTRQRQKEDTYREETTSTFKSTFLGTSILHIAVQGEHFETALELLKLDTSLRELEDDNGMTCLQLLANMPSSFKSGYRMGILKSILYFCLPNNHEDDDKNPARFCRLARSLNMSIWRLLCQGLPMMKKFWDTKRKHESAWKLAKSLIIMGDVSWEGKNVIRDPSLYYDSGVVEENDEKQPGKETKSEGEPTSAQGQGESQSTQNKTEIPLLLATRHGIVEIVKEILTNYPQAVEHNSHMRQNILHVAIKHRQKKIFDHVKEMRITMTRLVRGIDNDGYTILHHAARLDIQGTLPGPVLQLQAELKWFKEYSPKTIHMGKVLLITEPKAFQRTQKHVPPHYTRHVEREGQTADELFKNNHEEQLKKAQKWIKETSQSCSAVAVLIATVVFAAAYTVPGGPDNRGLPIFLHSPVFLFFTIMDVVSLASSLTSVVMFLSILTSPFEQQDFLKSLPRKLTLGFTLLFFSVMTTMLAFAATIVLIIRLSHKRWTTVLIYVSAFFPVTVFALMEFPLFTAFMGTLKDSVKNVRKFLFCKKKMSINIV